MVTKLTDRELNAKLMECLGDNATADVKNAFNSLMKEKVAQIRNEVRQEVFEELSKQAKQDKAKIVESMNDVTNKVINEEMKKLDLHRKNAIKEKLKLKEARDNMAKVIADKTALIQEDYNNKLANAMKSLEEQFEAKKADFVEKASAFLNESVKKEVVELRESKKQLGESLNKFGKFVSEQVKAQTKAHRDEMKSLDALRVRIVKENAEKLADDKKKFFTEAADKMEKFINTSVSRELNEFRKDIAESRKKSFGSKIFEAFAKEFAVKFFNENKVVNGLLESVKANQNKLMHSNKVLEDKQAEIIKENKQLKAVNNRLTREKMISESVAHLAKDKQDMIKNLVKDVPTEQLNESIKKYIPMILSNSSAKQINKNERVLKESRKPTILTGENKQNKVAMGFDEIDSDVDAEISKIIENSKFNY